MRPCTKKGAPALSELASGISAILDRNAPSLNALGTALAIAQANLNRTKAFLFPGVALNPPDVASRSPLFSLSYAPASESSGAFGATITTPETLTTQGGGGLSLSLNLSQALPTAGTVRLTAGGSLSLASRDSEQTWGAGGFAGLSLDQPLFQGPGILRLDHAKNNLRKATLEVEGTMAARQSALQAISQQVLRLLATRINLQESRWTLAEQAALAEQSLAQIRRDLSGGAASQADLRRQLLARDALIQSVADLDGELAKLDSSLRSLGGAELLQLAASTPAPAVPPLAETISRLEAALSGSAALADWYAADDGWQTAWRASEQARLDTLLGTAADAPRLGLSINLIPKASSGLESAADAFKELIDPDKASWQLSATFQATDLGLRARKNTEAILAARTAQAAADLQQAEQEVRAKLEGWLQDALRLDTALASRLADYEAARSDLTEEETRARQGASSQDLLQRRRLAEFSAAFRLLAALRDTELLVLQVRMAQ